MKKIFLFLLFLPLVANADDSGTCGENVNYTFSERNHTLTIYGEGKMSDQYSPWEQYRDKIDNIDIQFGVTSIGSFAFSRFNLHSISIPTSIISIGRNAFSGCSIEELHVFDLSSWMNINFEDFSNPASGAKHFILNGNEINNLIIPSDINIIHGYAFRECNWITSVTFHSNVERIEKYAFAGCNSITALELPNSLISIGLGAFQYCGGITSLTIPNSVTEIGHMAFMGCENLSTLNLSNKLKTINEEAFSTCSNLKTLVIPNGITKISDFAFSRCYSLKSVVIPPSITDIAPKAFNFCSLNDVYISDIESWIKNSFGIAVLSEFGNNTHLFLNGEELKELEIPIQIISIGDGSFMGCESLTSIKFHNGIKKIGERSFYRCTGITTIELPNSLESIGNAAFFGCTGIKSISIPEQVDSIGDGAFSECENLEDIYSYAENPPYVNDSFRNIPVKNCTLHVPSNSLSNYKLAEYWKNFGSIIAITDDDPKPATYINVLNTKGNNFSVDIYTSDGKRILKPMKGLNIIRMGDGSTKKVIME